MTTEFVRDAAATAAIFGFFASAWFGWAQDRPPPSWRRLLVGGSVAAVLIAVAGGVVTWRNWSSGDCLRRRHQPDLRPCGRPRVRRRRSRGAGAGAPPPE